MQRTIELAIESADGVADCRIDIVNEDKETVCTATILYPHLVGGRLLSKVYEHNLNLNRQTGMYYFADPAMVHPEVLLLEKQLSDAISSM